MKNFSESTWTAFSFNTWWRWSRVIFPSRTSNSRLRIWSICINLWRKRIVRWKQLYMTEQWINIIKSSKMTMKIFPATSFKTVSVRKSNVDYYNIKKCARKNTTISHHTKRRHAKRWIEFLHKLSKAWLRSNTWEGKFGGSPSKNLTTCQLSCSSSDLQYTHMVGRWLLISRFKKGHSESLARLINLRFSICYVKRNCWTLRFNT